MQGKAEEPVVPAREQTRAAEDPQEQERRSEDARRAAWGAVAERYAADAEPWTSQTAPTLLAVSGLGPRSEFLDLGCGAGALSIAAQTLGALTTAVDIAPGMIAAAAARPGAREAAFRIGDARALDAREGAFDAAVANFSVLETGAPEQVLAEVHRALRPGGRFAWTCWPGPTGGRLFEIVEAAWLSAGGLSARSAATRGLDAEAAAAMTRAAGYAPVEAMTLRLSAPADAEAVLAATEALDATLPKVKQGRAALISALREALAEDARFTTEAILVVAEKPGAGDGAAEAGSSATSRAAEGGGEATKPSGGLLRRLGRWLRRG